jgi:hypothetical protein
MTAGEGEFLGIDETAARIKMQAGKSLLEDIAGRSTPDHAPASGPCRVARP